MKIACNVFLIVILLITKRVAADTIPYIEIEHVSSVDSKYILPLLISKQTIDKSPFFSQSEYDSWKKLFPKKDDFLDSEYNFIVTDPRTFKLINRYINDQQKKYSYISLMASGFMITTIDKKEFFISDEIANQFFNTLITYLRKKGCDENLLNALKYK